MQERFDRITSVQKAIRQELRVKGWTETGEKILRHKAAENRLGIAIILGWRRSLGEIV